MKCELKVFYLLLIINLSNCAPHLKNDKREVIKYLKSYGYYHLITAEDGSEISHEQLKYSIRQLQVKLEKNVGRIYYKKYFNSL